jgi:amino acid transporter
MTRTSTPPKQATESGLRPECLPFSDVFAQSIATIAPTVGPALTIALVHESAGAGTWLTYVIATAAMLLVAASINVFASRSASPGALSDVVAQGLGPRAGVVAAWALCLAYLFTAMAVSCGFANFMDVLLAPVTGPLPVFWELACVGIACVCACRDVRLSTGLMLALEIGSLTAIVALAVIVVLTRGTLVDPAQLELRDVTPGGVMFGLVLATLSFVGFESATTLGHEARDPLRTIPRAVTTSTLFSGVFYVIMSYVEVLGFSFLPRAMHASPAPLDELAAAAGVGFLGAAISVGAAVSMFACTLACINAVSRIIYAMARQAIVHESYGRTHDRAATPHVAAMVASVVIALATTAVSLTGVTPLDGFAAFGSLGTYGFLIVYVLVSVAAPRYLARRGELRAWNVLCSALAVAMMAMPFAAAVGLPLPGSPFPVPAYPYDVLPYAFVLLLAAASAWSLVRPRGW